MLALLLLEHLMLSHLLCAQDSVQKWLSPGSNTRTLAYKASMMTITPPSQHMHVSQLRHSYTQLCHLYLIHEPSSHSHNCSQFKPLLEFPSQVSFAHLGWTTRCHVIGGNDQNQPTKYTGQKGLPLKIGPLMSIIGG